MKVIGNMHHIRKYILRVLTMNKWVRFRDMRPKNVDSNLYNYHLKELIKGGYVERHAVKGYRLSPMGLRYVDHVSLESFEPRWQPKILTKIYVTNERGELLMWPKYKQPFIHTWSLPSGKMHYDDPTSLSAAKREISYFTDSPRVDIEPRGIAEVITYIDDKMVTHGIEYLFSMTLEASKLRHESARWIDHSELVTMKCSPGTNGLIQELKENNNFFCKTYRIDW